MKLCVVMRIEYESRVIIPLDEISYLCPELTNKHCSIGGKCNTWVCIATIAFVFIHPRQRILRDIVRESLTAVKHFCVMLCATTARNFCVQIRTEYST